MNADKFVEVQYTHPETGTPVWSVGLLRDGDRHILLIYETIGQDKLYSYTIIPKAFVNKITYLRLADK
jgi:hypothetical protein